MSDPLRHTESGFSSVLDVYKKLSTCLLNERMKKIQAQQN